MLQSLLCAVLLLLTGNTLAGTEVLVEKVWLRESVPDQGSASLQLNLTATKPARLIGVNSPWAEAVEIQRLLPSRGKIQAHVMQSLFLSRNRTVAFGEHNFALMMVGLKKPLKVGDHVPVNLMVELSGKRVRTVRVEAEVKELALSYKHYGDEKVHDHQ